MFRPIEAVQPAASDPSGSFRVHLLYNGLRRVPYGWEYEQLSKTLAAYQQSEPARQSGRSAPSSPPSPEPIVNVSLVAAGPGGRFPIAAVRKECIQFSDIDRPQIQDCRVSEFGEMGTVDSQRYYYAIYCLLPSDVPGKSCAGDSFEARYHRARGLVIFVDDGQTRDRVSTLFERVNGDIGLFDYSEKPEIIGSAIGTILYLPIAVDGTGHGNASEYYLRATGTWARIESEAWLADLKRRLPDGVGISKGVWPNLRTMQAEAGLYRPQDANCCPTGGVAHVQLAIKGERFVITSVSVN